MTKDQLENELEILRKENKEIREKLQLYESIFKLSMDGIAILDENGIYVEQNAKHEEVLGYSNKDLEKQTPSIHMGEEMFSHIGKTLETTGAYDGVFKSKTKSGNIRDIHLSSFPVMDDENNLKYLVGIKRDITEHLQAQKALEEREKTYRSLVENSIQGLVIAQDNPTRISFASGPMEKIFGDTPEELTSLSAEQIASRIYEEDRLQFLENFQKRINGEEVSPRSEFRIIHKSGEIRWVELFSSKIEYNGEPATQAVYVDITERKRSYEEIKKREETYRLLAENMLEAIWCVDSNQKCQYVSPSIKNILGYSVEEYMNLTSIDHYTPDEWERVKELVKTKLTQNFLDEGVVFETNQIHKNGSIVPVEISMKVIMGDDGKTLYFQGSTQDISERKQAEKDLIESEARYRTLVENAPESIIVLNATDGLIIDVNENAEKLIGISREEMFQKTPGTISPPTQPDGTPSVNAARNYVMQAIDGEIPVFEWMHWNFERQEEVPCEVRLVKLPSSKGTIVRGSVIDISERKKAEQKLRNSEKLLATTLSSVGDAVITTDINGQISFMNPVAEELTGWKLSNAKYKPLQEVFNIVNEKTVQEIENPAEKVLRDKKKVELANHTALISKDGIERPIADSGAPIIDDEGNVFGVVLVFRDMSEEREREATLRHQQKLEAIGTLAGGVAHEINNPTNIIMNFGQLIVDNPDDAKQVKTDAQEIINESIRIAGIVKNLLAFSRHDSDPHTYANISKIIESTLSLTSKLLKNDLVTIKTELLNDPPRIRCRNQQVMQVIMNLITNARDSLNEKYGNDGTLKEIRLYSKEIHETGKKWVRITVEDEGVGIPPEIRKRIFDPFFTSKPKDKGTGLGLSVSYGIIQEHGGRMTVQSEPGQGAKFHVDLPVED